MTINEFVAVGVGILTVFSLIAGFAWKFSAALKGVYESISSDIDKKVTRVYERLDEEKQKNDVKFSGKELCALRHEQLERTMKDIDDKLSSMNIDIRKLLLRVGGNDVRDD